MIKKSNIAIVTIPRILGLTFHFSTLSLSLSPLTLFLFFYEINKLNIYR